MGAIAIVSSSKRPIAGNRPNLAGCSDAAFFVYSIEMSPLCVVGWGQPQLSTRAQLATKLALGEP
jgi:hypothetical protein